jgi:hypothetical protein
MFKRAHHKKNFKFTFVSKVNQQCLTPITDAKKLQERQNIYKHLLIQQAA